MSAVHLNSRGREPIGLSPDADPFCDDYFANRRRDAVRGSRRLKKAIWRLQLPPMPKRAPSRLQSWPVRQMNRVHVEHIMGVAAAYFGLSLRDMHRRRGPEEVAHQRQMAMYLARRETKASYPDIAWCFGKRDHTTILYAVGIVNQRIIDDPVSAMDFIELRARLAAA